MSETIVVGGRECHFVDTKIYGVRITNGHHVLGSDGRWHHWSQQDATYWPTEAAAREFAKRHADAQPRRAGRYSDEPAPEAERDIRENCTCRTCDPNDWRAGKCRMHFCEFCGNKRCPHAEWHGYECTGSNESGQVPTLVDPGTQGGAELQTLHVVGCSHYHKPLGSPGCICEVANRNELAELRAEVERLREERELWFRQYTSLGQELARLTAQLAAAERERDALREACEFYIAGKDCGCIMSSYSKQPSIDGGTEKIRAALATKGAANA